MKKPIKLITVVLILVIIMTFVYLNPISAQNTNTSRKVEGVIVKILEEKQIEVMQKKQLFQKLAVKLTEGNKKGSVITVTSGDVPLAKIPVYKTGDNVVLTINDGPGNNDSIYISDYVRRDSLYWLFGIFIALAVLIAGKRGTASVIGMFISFFVIFQFILPQILQGANPVFISILGSMVIIPLTFYLSHGINIKSTMSVLGTIISLIITGLLAYFYIQLSRLSGFSSDEASFLQTASSNSFNMQGILLAGIIIGLLGILDDITISQAAIVYQLKKTSPALTFKELYAKGMDIGSDHIASMVNTLVLVYAGASMPLLLLFINNPHPFSEVLNYEMIAEEVVRTLVASIGLILAVPITTFLTAYYLRNKRI